MQLKSIKYQVENQADNNIIKQELLGGYTYEESFTNLSG